MAEDEGPLSTLLFTPDELELLAGSVRHRIGQLSQSLQVSRAEALRVTLQDQLTILWSLHTALAEAFYGVTPPRRHSALVSDCPDCHSDRVVRESTGLLVCEACAHRWDTYPLGYRPGTGS